MDLALYARVLARSWRVVLGGFALAVLLAVLAVARPSLDGGVPHFEYRDPEIWQSQTTVLLTTPGGKVPFADPGRFYGLAEVYAQLVGGDEVNARLRRDGSVRGSVSGSALQSSSGNPTSLIGIFGKASNQADAVTLANQATTVFIRFVNDQQRAAGIPRNQRVVVQSVKAAEPAVLIAPRSKTLPIMVFLGIISAAVGFAFVRENLRTRAGRAIGTDDVLASAPAEDVGHAAEEAVGSRWVSDPRKARSSFLR